MEKSLLLKIIFFSFLKNYIKKTYPHSYQIIIKNAKQKYDELLKSADNIGKTNPMKFNMHFVLCFLSFHLANKEIIKEEDIPTLISIALSNKLLNKFASKTNYNILADRKKAYNRMHKYEKWYLKNGKKFPSTWEVEIDKNIEKYYSFNFYKCPIAKFLKDIHQDHLTHYFCSMDYDMVKKGRGILKRDYTIAKDGTKCDFKIYGDGELI